MTFHQRENHWTSGIHEVHTGTEPSFVESLRSSCETFVRANPDIIPALSVTLVYRQDELLQTLQVISLLAEEYGLKEHVQLNEQAVTVRFTRVV